MQLSTNFCSTTPQLDEFRTLYAKRWRSAELSRIGASLIAMETQDHIGRPFLDGLANRAASRVVPVEQFREIKDACHVLVEFESR